MQRINFVVYDALMEKYEQKELKTEGYSFTERDLQMLKNYDHPEEFTNYLLFLSTKLTVEEDKNRLNKFLCEFIELVDDSKEGETYAE